MAGPPESADLAGIVSAAPSAASSAGSPADDLAASGAPTFDGAHFRTTLGHFATGITIVTGIDGGEPVGLTCQSFTSVSLDPPLIAFAPGKNSSSWPRIRGSGAFCVNVLTEEQEDICRVFATSGADKFRGVGWRPAETGSPVIDDSLAWLDCRIVEEHDAGDHVIVVGRVLELDSRRKGRPLLFYRGGYGRFEA
jgi:3-hydroxy-9,10-secoandrosta-1,3,5(10)-triene-9,17-dione monooxygenase reductase component